MLQRKPIDRVIDRSAQKGLILNSEQGLEVLYDGRIAHQLRLGPDID